MDNNDDNLNPMPTEAPVETPTETPAPEAPIDIETTDEPAPADAPVEAPAEETPAEPEAPAEETPVEETPAEPEAPAETPAEEAPAEAPIEETAPIEPSVPVETPVEPTEPAIESNPVASPVIESAPIDMAAPVAPAETPKKKSKAGLIIAAIALIVILSGAIIAILIISNTPTTPNKGGNNSNNNSNNSQVVEEEEVALEEGAETKLMNDNLSVILEQKKNNGKPLTLVGTCINYASNILNGSATANQKLDNLLRYLLFFEEGSFKKINPADYKSDEDLSKYYGLNSDRESFFGDTTVISADVVADRYFELFGEEVEHKDANSLCGGFFYDPNHKVYYNGPLNACGCLPMSGYYLNLVGYAKKGTSYYVDYRISAASVEDIMDKNDKNLVVAEKINYYDGVGENAKIIKTSPEGDQLVDEDANTLTGEEWAKVKIYRFTFDKDGDNLFFKTVSEKQ